MDIRKIIKKPLITEKATILREKENKYIFMVDKDADKQRIKEAVEQLFKVKVEDVHTCIVGGKLRRRVPTPVTARTGRRRLYR